MQIFQFTKDNNFWKDSKESFMLYLDYLLSLGIILHLIGFFTYENLHLDSMPAELRYLRFIPIGIFSIALIINYFNKKLLFKYFDYIFILIFLSSSISITIIQNHLNFGLNYFHNFISLSVICSSIILIFPLQRIKFHISIILIYLFYFYMLDYNKVPINDLTFLIRTSILFTIVFSIIYHLLQLIKYKNYVMKIELNKKNNLLNEEIKTKNEFLSLIAHDIRNPLQLILFITEYLNVKFKIGQTKNFGSKLEDLNNGVQDLINLTENLFAWINGHKGTLKAKKEIFDLNNSIIKIFKMNKNIAFKKKIDLNYELSENKMIFADKNMIEVIIRNFIQNAIKFTPENGNIFIKTEPVSNGINISIKDSGVGLEDTKITNLLTKDNIESTRGTENEKGTGLGLVICKKYLKLNGSELNISSQLYKGSTFSFVLKED